MADYAIGDVQGCYGALQRLLERIQFNERIDRLWFVGDLVNRGLESLAVLRFIHDLPIEPVITLGNHDLHLLAALFARQPWKGHNDTIEDILSAPDGEELGHWLRKQAILYHAPEFNVAMCHAGIAPIWDLPQAMSLAKELENVLSGEAYVEFLSQMYGNTPNLWSDQLSGVDRLRVITNYFTRMRYCDAQGALTFDYKGSIENRPAALYPWYEVPHRKAIAVDIVFGHWAALMGKCSQSSLYAIDTGCFWGGPLTALRLQDKQRFFVPGNKPGYK